MNGFPRTEIEGLSVSRLIMGTNWWLGYSHQSQAKDKLIKETMTAERIAPIIEAFLEAGVDTILGPRPNGALLDAIKTAEDRTGRGTILIGTPHLDLASTSEAYDENCRRLDDFAGIGTRICMPHQCSTDAMVDRMTRTVRGMPEVSAMIRERGMIPGLSTHVPESVVYADETDLDVATYIQIYNAIGFLMTIEVDWIHRLIWRAKKPVLTIKPMAAGRLHPLPGLAFAWSTIRDVDMVAVGTQTPDEARELVELSLSLLERRTDTVELQRTRSKASIDGK